MRSLPISHIFLYADTRQPLSHVFRSCLSPCGFAVALLTLGKEIAVNPLDDFTSGFPNGIERAALLAAFERRYLVGNPVAVFGGNAVA